MALGSGDGLRNDETQSTGVGVMPPPLSSKAASDSQSVLSFLFHLFFFFLKSLAGFTVLKVRPIKAATALLPRLKKQQTKKNPTNPETAPLICVDCNKAEGSHMLFLLLSASGDEQE